MVTYEQSGHHSDAPSRIYHRLAACDVLAPTFTQRRVESSHSSRGLLTSHAWRQDHNGYSHQGPSFMDVVINKKGAVVRIYLPPDANCLLSVVDHCLRSRNYVNVIVAGKQPELQWLDMDAARRHCARGASVWRWASNDEGDDPDMVLACAGDVPTLETRWPQPGCCAGISPSSRCGW